MVSSGAEQPLLTRGSVPSRRVELAPCLCLCFPILSCREWGSPRRNRLTVPARKSSLSLKKQRGKILISRRGSAQQTRGGLQQEVELCVIN